MPDDLSRDDLSADLSSRFSGLAGAPVPPLAGAAAARARGEQRTRRTRAVLSGSGALVAVLAVVAATSLSGGAATRETLPQATTAPTTQAVSEDERLARVAEAALITVEDVTAALGGDWEQAPSGEPAPPDTCTETPVLPSETAGAQRAMSGPDGAAVSTLVWAYDSAATAQDALGALVDRVEACPEPPGGTARVLGGLPGAGPDRAYVAVAGADGNRVHAVQRTGQLLVSVRLAAAGVEPADVVPLADSAQARAETAQSTGGAEIATWRPSDAFLGPDDATAAEPTSWRATGGGDVRMLLDPCSDPDYPRRDALAETGLQTLVAEREIGGSLLVQQVLRYTDGEAAEEAFDAYLERTVRCPEQSLGDPEQVLRLSSEISASAGAGRQALVRQVPCSVGTDSCADHFTTYVLVAVVGDGLMLATYEQGEDGDPADEARALLDAAAGRLRAVVTG